MFRCTKWLLDSISEISSELWHNKYVEESIRKTSMNIFFIASIHGKKKYLDNYTKIVDLVKQHDHKINAEQVLNTESKDILENPSEEEVIARYKKSIKALKRADAVFAEASYGSTSAGYLVALAASIGKPVVIFYSGDEEPHIFRAVEATNDKVVVVRYKDLRELDQEVPMMLDFISDSQDTRFNFFVSPGISSYLDWVSKQRRIPRSVYLRKLIDIDMDKNDDYMGG